MKREERNPFCTPHWLVPGPTGARILGNLMTWIHAVLTGGLTGGGRYRETIPSVVISYWIKESFSIRFGCLKCKETGPSVVLSYCFKKSCSAWFGCMECRETAPSVVLSYCFKEFCSTSFGCMECRETAPSVVLSYCCKVSFFILFGCLNANILSATKSEMPFLMVSWWFPDGILMVS